MIVKLNVVNRFRPNLIRRGGEREDGTEVYYYDANTGFVSESLFLTVVLPT